MASFEAVAPLPMAAQYLSEHLAAAGRIFAILDAEPAVEEPALPVQMPKRPAFLHSRSAIWNSHIRDRPPPYSPDSTSKYPQEAARRGRTLSGAGKSTLAHLLLRFWDPTRGEIRLAGTRLKDYRLEDLRRTVGVLSQRTSLFSASLRDNVTLARPEATQEELDEAAHRAQLLQTISTLPEGWDTWIGEKGHRLSGGERQRVAIARMLLIDPPLLILDEPTTGLDTVTEKNLWRSLSALAEGRTTILITHRLESMDDMDRILVLDGGRMVESGTHRQLIARDGLYRLFHEAQKAEPAQ